MFNGDCEINELVMFDHTGSGEMLPDIFKIKPVCEPFICTCDDNVEYGDPASGDGKIKLTACNVLIISDWIYPVDLSVSVACKSAAEVVGINCSSNSKTDEAMFLLSDKVVGNKIELLLFGCPICNGVSPDNVIPIEFIVEFAGISCNVLE